MIGRSKEFLITTACPDFYPEHEKIVFLGEWCRDLARKEASNSKILPFIWAGNVEVLKAINYCGNFFEIVLDRLTTVLNEYHKKDFSNYYYRIVLGNWLLCYVHVLYDRYLCIKTAKENLGDFDTVVLDETLYVVPYNYLEFVDWISDDFYNLQIFSQIINWLYPGFSSQKTSQTCFHHSPQKSLKDIIQCLFLKTLSVFSDKQTTIVMPYFHREKLFSFFKLFINSNGRLNFDDFKYEIVTKMQPNFGARKIFEIFKSSENEFEKLFWDLLPMNLPVIFFEDFESFRSQVQNLSLPESKCFFTSNALQTNDIFKFHYASCYGKTRMLNFQHGSGYGVDEVNVPEEYERSISDCFLTWGWKKFKNDRPLSNNFYSNGKVSSEGGVLFAFNSYPRYIHRFATQAISSSTLKLMELAGIFINTLAPFIGVTFRNHPKHSYGWNIEGRLKEIVRHPSWNLDKMKDDFWQALAKNRILVVNSLGTTLLEALASNKPTVFFFDPEINSVRENFKPFLKEFFDHKIFHTSAESAAKHVNQVFAEIEDWWENPSLQNVRMRFCAEFARTSRKWAQEWVVEFDSWLEKSPLKNLNDH